MGFGSRTGVFGEWVNQTDRNWMAVALDGGRVGVMMGSTATAVASVGTPGSKLGGARELGSGRGGICGSSVGAGRDLMSKGRVSRLPRRMAGGIVAKVASGTRVESSGRVGVLPIAQQIVLDRLKPSSTSGAMEELELERGVCNPFRKYTADRVSGFAALFPPPFSSQEKHL